MTILINNPVVSTWIFIAIFSIAIFIFSKKKDNNSLFPVSLTHELKGFAILAIVFSHIGYFLSTDHRFLFPLSIIAGVGVDLFLFLSGFGLATSAIKNKLPIKKFYKNQLLKLFTPFWITLTFFLLLDFFILKITYSWQFITKAFFGIFTTADIYRDLNSPLWYFTLILFYYLIFPLLFFKKRPWISAIVIYCVSYFLLWLKPDFISSVTPFYKVHIVAFPTGILFAWLTNGGLKWPIWLEKLKHLRFPGKIATVSHYLLLIILAVLIGCLVYYCPSAIVSGDTNKQQLVSIIAALLILLLFLIKKFELKLFYLFGIYSYEIYLFHWPLLYRYDIFYKYLPAWLATIFYLIFFLGLAWGFNNFSRFILKKLVQKQ